MSETYIINGQVYVGRRFQRKTISVSAGKIRLMDPDVLLRFTEFVANLPD